MISVEAARGARQGPGYSESIVRIGLIGTDNSHAEAFLQLLNEAQRHLGARIVGVWGADADRTRDLADRFGVSRVVAEPHELVGEVDAAMVVDRHGDEHFAHALP